MTENVGAQEHYVLVIGNACLAFDVRVIDSCFLVELVDQILHYLIHQSIVTAKPINNLILENYSFFKHTVSY